MKRIFLVLALITFSTVAHAQCTGNAASGRVCGNDGATSAPAGYKTLTSIFDRALCGTNNSALARISGSWVCLASANNGVWITSAGGVPSISSTLPNAVQDNVTRTGVLTTPKSNLGLPTLFASDYGVVCNGSTDNNTALAAITTALGTGGATVVFPDGDCRYSAWSLNAMVNIVLQGQGGLSQNTANIGTSLTCTLTSAATCLTYTNVRGGVIRDIAIVKDAAHTGRVIDASSTASTWNKIRFENVEFRRSSGTSRNGTALYIRNNVDITFNNVRISHAANGIVGGNDGETTTGTAVLQCNSCDFVDLTVAVRNPGPFWSFFGGAWEQTLTNAPVTLLSQATDTVKAIGFYGVVFTDATAAGRWMTFNGGVWGFTMSGGSMAGVAATDGILFAGAAGGTQGVSINGVNIAGLGTAITFTGTCAGTSITGNVFTTVTNRVVNASGSCYTSNWWPGNAPSVFNNAAPGTLYTPQTSADPIWSATPTLGIVGTATGTIGFRGTTSGVVTVQPQAAAGTYNFNLPNNAGTLGFPLLSGGGGATAQTYGGAMTGVTTLDTTGNVSTTLSTNGQVKHAVVNVNAGASANAAHTIDTNAGGFSSVAASTAGGGGYGATWTGAGGMTFNQANATGGFIFNTGAGFTPRMTIANAGTLRLHAYGAGSLLSDASGNITSGTSVTRQNVALHSLSAMSAATNYLWHYSDAATGVAGETQVQGVSPAAGRYKLLYLNVVVAPGGSATVKGTVRVNGSDTALTCTITGAATSCNDLVNTATIAVNQTYSVKVEYGGGAAASRVFGGLQFENP